MRALIAALLLGQFIVDDDFGGSSVISNDDRVVFHAALARNGMSAWNDLPANFPTPTVAWMGSAPTLNSVDGTTAFTESGTASSAVNSPLCADGGWDDLSQGCMATRRGVAATVWTGANTLADCTGDCSACSIYRMAPTASTTGVVASQDDADAEGWKLWNSTGRCGFYVENTAAGSANALCPAGDERAGSWMVVCGTHDYDGNTTAYKNGTAGTAVASPGGTITSGATGMRINAGEGASTGIIGDIAAVLYWQTTVLSAAQVASFSDWVMGTHEEKGTVPTFSNTGPTCCWVAGSLQCFSDNFSRKGCEVPPGLTGAGGPTTCAYHATPSATQRLLQVPTLNTTWTAVGTSVVATSTVSMFADGRQMYKATDDNAGGAEYIHQTVAKGGATTGVLCVFGQAESGTGNVHADIEEITGCTDALLETIDFAINATTPNGDCVSWAESNAACSNARIYIHPTDGVAASTGHAALLAQWYTGQTWVPSQFIPTVAAAVTSGLDLFRLPDNSTAESSRYLPGNLFSGEYIVEVEFTPFVSDYINVGKIWYIATDGAGDVSGAALEITATETLRSIIGTSAAVGATTGVQTFTPGTPMNIRTTLNYDSDRWTLAVDGAAASVGTTAAATSTSVDTLRIGNRNSDLNTIDGGFCVRDLKITRP